MGDDRHESLDEERREEDEDRREDEGGEKEMRRPLTRRDWRRR